MFKFIKNWILVIAILLGVIIHPWVEYFAFLSPYLISLVLVFAFSAMSIRQLKLERSHLLFIVLQIAFGAFLYIALAPYDKILAMGVMVCALCPTASSAPAVVRMLGGNVAYIASYLFFVNIVMAVVIPLFFSYVMNSESIAFGTIFIGIAKRVGALLLVPLVLARLIKRYNPKLNNFFVSKTQISFYIWAIALVIVIANTIRFLKRHYVDSGESIFFMIIASLFICVMQFWVGRKIGKRYGDSTTLGQAFGQKNTILAIWMTQSFLSPFASIVPAGYILWQNIINSYELYKSRKK